MKTSVEERKVIHSGKRIRLMFQDEAGFGRINKPKYRWCVQGIRPSVPCHHIREYRYAYGAAEPLTGDGYFLVMPYCNTACMNIFLKSYVPVIANGDVDALVNMLRRNRDDQYFQRYAALDEHLRATPAMSLGMYSVIAYEYGIPLEIVSILSKKYLHIAETIQNTTDLNRCLTNMLLEFTEHIRNFRLFYRGSSLGEKCYGYICTHIYDKIKIKEIADYCGYSVSGLQHRYKRETGMSITEAVRREKVLTAESFLTVTELSIAEISNILGFCSESHFISSFKKEKGISPSKYRKCAKATEQSTF